MSHRGVRLHVIRPKQKTAAAGERRLRRRPQNRPAIQSTASNQWIVETHSESLMLRLQRRMREHRIRAEDVSVLYVEPGGTNGSRIMQLRLDEHGEFIDEWPQGFFEERYADVFEEKN